LGRNQGIGQSLLTAAKQWIGKACYWISEIRMVKHIEELSPELEGYFVFYMKLPSHRKILLPSGKPTEHVSSKVTLRPIWWIAKG
jgi:hypothetical protein